MYICASYICASYTHASGSRIMKLCTIDTCIIHLSSLIHVSCKPKIYVSLCQLMLGDADWCWVMLIYAEADWYRLILMLILLILILMLTVLHASERTSVPWTVIVVQNILDMQQKRQILLLLSKTLGVNESYKLISCIYTSEKRKQV